MYYLPIPDGFFFLIVLIIALPVLMMTLWTGLAATSGAFAYRLAVVSGTTVLPAGLLFLSLADPWTVLVLMAGLFAFILFVSGVIYLLWNAE